MIQKTIYARTKIYEKFSFPYMIKDQAKHSEEIRNTESLSELKKEILSFKIQMKHSFFIEWY